MKKKKILIRFDDICPTMDFHQFQIAIEELDRFKIKPLLGVIPFNKDSDLMISDVNPNFWSFIKDLQAKGYTIAMHGYEHSLNSHCRGKVVSRFDSEFAGHSLEVQIDKIRKGKEILESHGIITDVFFAPAHSYDDYTLKALSLCGFKYLSDGKSLKPYKRFGVTCLPCRSGGIPKMKFGIFHTAIFHAHEWAWKHKKQDYVNFHLLISRKDVEFVDFNTYKLQSQGYYFVQVIFERIYVFLERYIRPILVNIKHKI